MGAVGICVNSTIRSAKTAPCPVAAGDMTVDPLTEHHLVCEENAFEALSRRQPSGFAEPNKPKPEVMPRVMPFIEHSRNHTIIEMENRLVVARVRVRVGVGSGFG